MNKTYVVLSCIMLVALWLVGFIASESQQEAKVQKTACEEAGGVIIPNTAGMCITESVVIKYE